jgi:dsRNA-specific ribonuclease
VFHDSIHSSTAVFYIAVDVNHRKGRIGKMATKKAAKKAPAKKAAKKAPAKKAAKKSPAKKKK